MPRFEQRRRQALDKEPNKRSIDDCIVVLYAVYRNGNQLSRPHELWLQVVNDASQLAETIRRHIIRTKMPRDFSVYTQIARLFCRLSAFIGWHLYEGQPQHRYPTAELMRKPPLDDYIGGPERYEKWILLKYPSACPTCGGCPCVCAAYREIMENRKNPRFKSFWKSHGKLLAKARARYRGGRNGIAPAVQALYDASIDDWLQKFRDIYGAGEPPPISWTAWRLYSRGHRRSKQVVPDLSR